VYEKTEAVEEHQEVPKVEVAVETIEALENRHGDRHLAIRHRRQPKKRTHGDGGSWKKLAAARRRMTRRAVPARRKGRCHPGMQQWNKGLGRKTADTSEERDSIQQDLQKNSKI
jgi:hypothetical protein